MCKYNQLLKEKALKMAEQNNANIGFEKQIWDAACVLWGHIPAAEYRKVMVFPTLYFKCL